MEDDRGSDVEIGIIISSVTKQAGNNVNPTWPFYFEEIFCITCSLTFLNETSVNFRY